MSESQTIMKKLVDQVTELDMNAVVATVNDALGQGLDAHSILTTLSEGMKKVGERFQTKEYFISDLIMAGRVMEAGVAVLEPHLKRENSQARGTIVLGTIKGDIHDIGKNIFKNLAESAGFKVIDLGLRVEASEFINAAKEHNPDIVGISALLTTTVTNIPEVIRAFEEAGLRDHVKIILGGAPITDAFAKEIGADTGVNDATVGVTLCETMMTKRR